MAHLVFFQQIGQDRGGDRFTEKWAALAVAPHGGEAMRVVDRGDLTGGQFTFETVGEIGDGSEEGIVDRTASGDHRTSQSDLVDRPEKVEVGEFVQGDLGTLAPEVGQKRSGVGRIDRQHVTGDVESQSRQVETHEGGRDLAVPPGSRGASTGEVDSKPEVGRQAEKFEAMDEGAGFPSHGNGQSLDGVGIACHVEQLLLVENRAVVTNPPGHDLGADGPPVSYVELGSKEGLNLAAVEGSSQFDFVEGSSSIGRSLPIAEHFDAIATLLLGSLQRLIGESEHGDG